MRLLAVPLLLSLAATLPAQNKIDTFTLPNGTLIPGWTTQTGSWKILNKQLVPAGGSIWHYLTNNATKGIKDCVIDIEVIHPGTKLTMFGGAVARHPGTATGTNFVMTKIQDNGSSGLFNTAWYYERPGSATSLTGTAFGTPTKHAVIRTFVQGNKGWFELDNDMDGIFEKKSAIRTFASTINASGFVGISGYQNPAMDNWKFYEALLLPDATTTPKIGTTYKMTLHAPLNGGTTPRPTAWLGLLSAGNKGIPLGNGVTIPLTLDSLLVNSLGFGWSGVLLTTKPTAQIALTIPNMPSLVGLKLWASALTIGASRPGGWGAFSNAHGFVVTK